LQTAGVDFRIFHQHIDHLERQRNRIQPIQEWRNGHGLSPVSLLRPWGQNAFHGFTHYQCVVGNLFVERK
jgi:hypothetical protein